MRIPFFLGGVGGDAKHVSSERLINCYISQDRSSKKLYVKGTPGLTSFATPGNGPIRGIYQYNDLLFAVSGDTLYSIDSAGTATSKGTLSTETGRVQFADNGKNNGQEMIIVDGTYGYIYDSSADTFTQIADADFPAADSVTFIDTYFIVNEVGTGKFWRSDGNDGTTWDSLAFATAEGDGDNLLAVIADRSTLWLIGEDTFEGWYNSGDLDNPFQRIPGSIGERGCYSGATVKQFNSSIAWLSRDREGSVEVVMATGPASQQAISTPGLLEAVRDYTHDSASAWVYSQDGREFYVLNWPEGTWVFDSSTGEWHQRSYYDGGHERHLADGHAYAFDKHLVYSYRDNNIYQLSETAYSDNGDPIVRDIIGMNLSAEEERIFLAEVQAVFDEGVGLTSGQGADPQVMLRWSKDGGNTYGAEMWRSIGAKGKYSTRAVWRNLGIGREWTFWLRLSDPVKFICSGLVGRTR